MNDADALTVFQFGTTVVMSILIGAVTAAFAGGLGVQDAAIFGAGVLGFAFTFALFSWAIYVTRGAFEATGNGGGAA